MKRQWGDAPNEMTMGECPKRKDSGNRGMPYVITHKDRQIGPTTMKSTLDTVNPKRGGMPQ